MPATAGSNGKKHGFGRDSWPLGRKDFRSDSINAHPWGWSGCPSTPACSAEGPTPLAAGHPGRVLPGGVRALVLHACAPSKVRGFLAGFAALDLDKVGKPLAR